MSKKTKISLLTIVAIIFISFTFIPVNPIRLTYPLPESQLKTKTWEEILNNTAIIDTFKVLNTGSVKVPLEGMLNTDKLVESASLEKHLWVDVFAFLFHHKEKGWFMIDSGLDSTFQKKGNIKGLLAGNYILESKQKSGQNIAAQLKIEKKKIRGIFFTHLHGDHTSGLPEVDSSIPKYVGKDDKYINIPFLYHSNHLTKNDPLYDLDWSKGVDLFPFEQVMDVFGDGTLLGIHTPGHSKGHLSYLLMTTKGPILLTGDASHTKYGFNNNIEPGWVDNQELAEKSLSQLRKFHKMYPDVDIIYGHEQ